ncbi:MAG: hypothetical protein JWQ14_2667 [Adhaeribacter sp.]|nr:hypothetical protein [Adhaeribacter sp.]
MASNWFRILVAFSTIFYLGACGGASTREENVQPAGPYFDVATFIQQQATLLNKEKPVVTKTVSENGAVAETKKVSNSDWRKELETFGELDINKPAFRNSYTSTRQQNPATGLTTLTYRKKPGYDGTVQYLIIYTDSTGQVVRLRGLQETQNVLLLSRRELELRCHTKKGGSRVISYNIQGLQKPVIFDTLRYAVFAKIG